MTRYQKNKEGVRQFAIDWQADFFKSELQLFRFGSISRYVFPSGPEIWPIA